jgi:bacillithiol biosynthesis cysteine-adding enzyme BshC
VGRSFSSAFLSGQPQALSGQPQAPSGQPQALSGEPPTLAFLPRDFRDAATRGEAARAAGARRASPAVLEVLAEQQARLPASDARRAHLSALARGEAAVVATGQQVGLFLGPLYSFYKAASAIAAARALEAESGVRSVPLFWLQTEDHDYAEVAACRVLGADGAAATLALPPEAPAEARVSLAHRRLSAEIRPLVGALGTALAGLPAADEVVALLGAHYGPDRTFAEAFAGVLATIFAEDGLLVLDPRDARVAAAAAPLYARALDDAEALEAALRSRGEALARAGFEVQIPVRDGCALVFFHAGDARGPRYRLKRAAGARWELAGASRTIDDAEARRVLASDPLRFSTSALLRPLVQDALLPTAAYVGGPAEVSYFAQLGPLYDALALPQPLVVPRARFRVIDAATRRRLHALGLSGEDAERRRDELVTRLAKGAAPGPRPEELRRVADGVAPVVDALAAALLGADAGAGRAVARTRATVDRALARLVARYERARASRDAVAMERLEKVQRALAPDGVPQERAYAWPSLAARHGVLPLRRLVLEHLARAPFPAAIQELAP